MYADVDFGLALLNEDTWLTARAEQLLDQYEGDLEVSMATVIERFLIGERFAFDRERAVTAIRELASYRGDPTVVYQASAYIDDGMTTLDAFHAALAGDAIVSSDGAYDDLDAVDRIRLEPPEDGPD